MAITKECRQCKSKYTITDDDLVFLDKISPEFAGKKYQIPPPTLCHECRETRRINWRNDRNLYHRKSDLTGKEIVSIYSPDKTEYKVWENELWHKQMDPMKYGREYDFSRPFFEQFDGLLQAVPRKATGTIRNENSDYSNQTWKSKNAYLCFNVGPAEDCYYCNEAWFIKDCMDCFYIKNCELCYKCFHTTNCNNSQYLEKCDNCSECYFCYDCIGCHNVVLSTGIRNKQYYIENMPYEKNEWLKKVDEMGLSKRSNVKKIHEKFQKLKLEAIHKFNENSKCENSTGDYLVECKDCKDCYFAHASIGCSRVINVDTNGKDCVDCDFIADAELSYESTSVAGFANHFCVWQTYCNNSLYCNFCENSSDCFGCVGLNHKQYFILNKQYSKEEYENTVAKIIERMIGDEEWGKFFPPQICYFAYNESVAQLYYPKTEEEAKKIGAKWLGIDYTMKFDGEYYEPDDDIGAYKNDEKKREELLAGVLKCETNGRPFKIVPQELAYCLKHNIPIATVHPDERY